MSHIAVTSKHEDMHSTDIKTPIRLPEQKSRLFKGSSSAGSCGHKGSAVPGAPWPAQRLLEQVQGDAQDGGGSRLSPRLTCLTLHCVWLCSRVGDVLTQSQPLAYSSEVETTHGELNKIQGGEDCHGELNFEMLLSQKLVVITQLWKGMKRCHL